MLRLAFDFIITWRETRTRPNAYGKNCNMNDRLSYNDFYINYQELPKMQ